MYAQLKIIKATHSPRPPKYRVEKKTIGMKTKRSRVACVGVSRLDGIGRHGLFIESSRTELESRWFARLNMKRFNHVQRTAFGSRKKIANIAGLEFVVSSGPDRALANANAVAGKTVVLRSLFVKR